MKKLAQLAALLDALAIIGLQMMALVLLFKGRITECLLAVIAQALYSMEVKMRWKGESK